MLPIDRAYVNHKFGERVSAKAGRFKPSSGGGLAFDGNFRRCSIERWQ